MIFTDSKQKVQFDRRARGRINEFKVELREVQLNYARERQAKNQAADALEINVDIATTSFVQATPETETQTIGEGKRIPKAFDTCKGMYNTLIMFNMRNMKRS